MDRAVRATVAVSSTPRCLRLMRSESTHPRPASGLRKKQAPAPYAAHYRSGRAAKAVTGSRLGRSFHQEQKPAPAPSQRHWG